MPLSDVAVRSIKPLQKPFKRGDDHGLYLRVQPNGSKLWRFNYTFAKRQKTLSFGIYSEVSLAEAREARDNAKKKLRLGQDPGATTIRKLAAINAAKVEAEKIATAKRIAKKQVNAARSFDLYRYYAANNRLLYVVISFHAWIRAAQHRNNSSWFNASVRMTVERFPTEKAAKLAEIAAIQNEKPAYNIIHAKTM